MSDSSFKEIQDKQDKVTLENIKGRFTSGDNISVPLIQRYGRCGYNSAYRVFEKLVSEGKIKRGEKITSVSKFM